MSCIMTVTRLPVSAHHAHGGLGARLLQLAVHAPDERAVVRDELVDGGGGVGVARAAAR